MNVLFVTTVPLETETGGGVFSRSVFNALSAQFNVKPLVLAEHQLIQNRTLRWIAALIKSVISNVPANIIFHSGFLDSRIKAVFDNGKWDIIILDHLESGLLQKRNSHLDKHIYISHNREGLVVEQKLPRFISFFGGGLRQWVESYEIKFVKTVDGIVSISEEECKWYRRYCDNVGVIYPVFTADERNKKSHEQILGCKETLRIGFLGGKKWRPNEIAVEYIVKQILPSVDRGVEFILAGSGWSEKDLMKLLKGIKCSGNLRLKVLGFVDHIEDFWQSIDLFLAPIEEGAGVNVKVCEALANSVPVVCSPYALRGLPAELVNFDLRVRKAL